MVHIEVFDTQLTELFAWRRDFHTHPEISFDVHRTAGLVSERLHEMGVDEVFTGIGKTGVVAVIKGKTTSSNKVIGLRADMDALPMQEQTNLPYASKIEGRMHACGHDGHTTMLLGAARYLSETRNFNGTAVLIFQPAEEAEGGGLAMVQDGLMNRFGIQSVFALHASPGLPIGHFSTRAGGIMGSADLFEVQITGKGCHAAFPHEGLDPAIAVAQIIQGFQTIVSRSISASAQHVVSITQVHMGTADNIIAETAEIRGTVRSLSSKERTFGKQRMYDICAGVASMTGTEIHLNYIDDLPVTENDATQTDFAIDAATKLVGSEAVDGNRTPTMGGEDFSFMLEQCPGNFMFIGNGDSAALHNPAFDFNDEALAYGCAYFATIVERQLAI
nr:M20 aminoacylase family protein [Roseobacter litoralis]